MCLVIHGSVLSALTAVIAYRIGSAGNIMYSNTRSYCCRQIIAHGCNCILGNKSAAVLHSEYLSSYNTGRTIACDSYLLRTQRHAHGLHELVYIYKLIIPVISVFRLVRIVLLHPISALLKPASAVLAFSACKE